MLTYVVAYSPAQLKRSFKLKSKKSKQFCFKHLQTKKIRTNVDCLTVK